MPLTLRQTAVDPHLRQRLLDAHRQVCFSLLWVAAPFSQVLVHTRFCLCPPRVCFPSPVEVLESNLSGLQSQVPWGFSGPLQDSQVGKYVVGPRNLQYFKNFFGIIVLQFVGHLLSSSIVKLMATSSKRIYALCHTSQLCCSQTPCPHGRLLLICASTGDTHTLKVRSGSVSYGGHCHAPWVWCAQGFVCTL